MVATAQDQKVAQLGLAPVDPVLDVMAVEPTAIGTAGEPAAALVARPQGTADRGGDRAGAAAHVERRAGGVLDDGNQARITGEAAAGLCGNAGAVFEVAGERGGVHVD